MTDAGVLNLPLPIQSGHVDPTLPVSVRELDQWIRNLPTADVARTTRQVFQAIVGTNGTRLAPDLRAELIERYHQQVQEIRDSLLPHFVGQPHPLPPANRRIVVSLEKLFRHLAAGYEIIVREGSPALGRRGVVGAIRALRDTVSIGYLGYQTPAAGVWQELHELFRFGSHLYAETDDAWAAPYKEALLLDLADPNRLTPGELRLTAAIVEALAPLALLAAPSPSATSDGIYTVAFAADAGPVEPQDVPLGQDPQTGRLFKTERVAESVSAAVKTLRSQGPEALPDKLRPLVEPRSAAFLERLAKIYARRPRRQHDRTFAESDIEIVKGVSALHSMIGGMSSDAEADGILLAGDARSGVNLAAEIGYSTDRWRQINHSAQGIGLLRGPEGDQRVQVGDLLGLKGVGGADSWVPVIVRRLRYLEEDLIVGVQMIAQRAVPASALHDAAKSPEQAVLLVQRSSAGQGQGTLLISQRGSIERTARVTLTVNSKQIPAQAGDLIESSDFFDIHELARVKTQ